MDRWNVQRVTCVRSYYETKSVTEVQRVFRRQFNVRRHGRVPSRNTILVWVKKFEETGSVFACHDYSRTQTSDC
jgi:transposase